MNLQSPGFESTRGNLAPAVAVVFSSKRLGRSRSLTSVSTVVGKRKLGATTMEEELQDLT